MPSQTSTITLHATASTRPRSPSPSPPPHPPTSLSPGDRAIRLQQVFDAALAHTLKACSYKNFAACFPTPAKYVPDALDALHREFVGRLGDACRNEFAALMDERSVVASLNELDALCADARKRMEREKGVAGQDGSPPTPLHLLPPSSLLAAHLAPFLSAQEASLQAQLQEVQARNKSLAHEAVAQRAEIEGLLSGLDAAVRDLKGAATVFEGEEMKDVEMELEKAATMPIFC